MVSKMVLDRQKLSQDVATWVSAHADILTSGLTLVLGDEAIGKAALEAIARSIDDAVARLIAADDVHTAELSDDARPRAERDQAAEAVGAELQFVRSAVQPLYGELGLKAVGLDVPITRDPAALSRLGHQFTRLVTAAAFQLPPPRKPTAILNVSAFADDLAPSLARLDTALRNVSQEEGEAQSTQAAKNKAFEAFEARFVAARDTLYDLSALCGRRDLGEKLPSLPRSIPAGAVASPPVPT